MMLWSIDCCSEEDLLSAEVLEVFGEALDVVMPGGEGLSEEELL